MSVVSGLGKAAGAEVLRGTRHARGKALPKTKKALVVVAVALLVLAAFAAMIPASEAKNVENYYSDGSVADRSGAGAPVSTSPTAAAPQMSEEEALNAYSKLPLSFIPNEGQTEEAVRYHAQGAGYGFFFTKEGAMLSFAEGKGHGHALALDFLGANPDAKLTAQKRLPGEVNYLVGEKPAAWQQGLTSHSELLYGGLWPGIDMAVRGEGGNLKYEFHLKPGSSVEDVRLAYRGAEGLSVGAGGALLVQTSLGVLKDAAPVSYQRIGGERVPVESRYTLEGDSGYGFAVGAYDPRYPLIIDPGLEYSTFLGGEGSADEGYDIAVDGSGNAYVTGRTGSSDYPTTPGAFDTSYGGSDTFGSDAYVSKLNATGSALVYSTFLGGTSNDRGLGIAVRDRKAHVTGFTESSDYPTTPGAFDTSYGGSDTFGSDAYVSKLNATGSALEYSTFLGGEGSADEGYDIAVDGSGMAYVTGQTNSSDFPTTPGAFDTIKGGALDAYVSKLNATGSALVYSTFLGGEGGEAGSDIAVDGSGMAYVTGNTCCAADFPTTPGAFDRIFNRTGNQDAYVSKLNATGSALVYSTFLGGWRNDRGRGIAVRKGRAYVTGGTESANFPTTPGAFDTTFNGSSKGSEDAYVSKLNARGSALVYSTYLGGEGDSDAGFDIAVDGSGMAYVTGLTCCTADFPTTSGAFDTTFNSGDAYVSKLNTIGSALVYSTFLGGSGIDVGQGIAVRGGMAYVTGVADRPDFPTTPGAFDTTFDRPDENVQDAFVTKLPTG
jgi:hypothetical protein